MSPIKNSKIELIVEYLLFLILIFDFLILIGFWFEIKSNLKFLGQKLVALLLTCAAGLSGRRTFKSHLYRRFFLTPSDDDNFFCHA